ncbi:MAG: hypothetical protein IKX60_06395 [Bacteroidales bacterium]|nr:hypothetical protein [Bacteroidales bacterium]
MKRIFTSVVMTVLFALTVSAQNTVMSTWPYLYPEFVNGTVYMTDGKKYEKEMNIHLAKGRLHFIDEGFIKEVKTNDIVLIELNGEQFVVLEGNVVKAVGDLDKGYVAVHTTVDFQKLNESQGAYGITTTNSATMKMSSVDLVGVNTNHMELRQNRNTGKEVALKNVYYIVTGGKVFNANKKGIESQLDDAGKAAFKTFQKQHKIKWQDPQSLLQLVDFINQQ